MTPRAPAPGRVPHRAAAILVAAIMAGGCSDAGGAGWDAPPPVELVVFAAASLRDVLRDVGPAYEAATPGVTLTVATDSSTTLRTQIEHGAPADVYLAADVANPRALAAAGLVDGAPVVFARNRLTLVAPADNPAGISTPADLARPGVRIIAASDAVPITGYADQLVANLASLPGSPPDFASAYETNVVSREENVRSVVAKIELGEGDAAIVYRTDVTGLDDVGTIELPEEANVDAAYSAAVVAATAHPHEARALLDWLTGREGTARLARFGFLPPA